MRVIICSLLLVVEARQDFPDSDSATQATVSDSELNQTQQENGEEISPELEAQVSDTVTQIPDSDLSSASLESDTEISMEEDQGMERAESETTAQIKSHTEDGTPTGQPLEEQEPENFAQNLDSAVTSAPLESHIEVDEDSDSATTATVSNSALNKTEEENGEEINLELEAHVSDTFFQNTDSDLSSASSESDTEISMEEYQGMERAERETTAQIKSHTEASTATEQALEEQKPENFAPNIDSTVTSAPLESHTEVDEDQGMKRSEHETTAPLESHTEVGIAAEQASSPLESHTEVSIDADKRLAGQENEKTNLGLIKNPPVWTESATVPSPDKPVSGILAVTLSPQLKEEGSYHNNQYDNLLDVLTDKLIESVVGEIQRQENEPVNNVNACVNDTENGTMKINIDRMENNVDNKMKDGVNGSLEASSKGKIEKPGEEDTNDKIRDTIGNNTKKTDDPKLDDHVEESEGENIDGNSDEGLENKIQMGLDKMNKMVIHYPAGTKRVKQVVIKHDSTHLNSVSDYIINVQPLTTTTTTTTSTTTTITTINTTKPPWWVLSQLSAILGKPSTSSNVDRTLSEMIAKILDYYKDHPSFEAAKPLASSEGAQEPSSSGSHIMVAESTSTSTGPEASELLRVASNLDQVLNKDIV